MTLPPASDKPCRNCGRPLNEHESASELCRCALAAGYLEWLDKRTEDRMTNTCPTCGHPKPDAPERLDAMFGKDKWVVCLECPAGPGGSVVHHRNFHSSEPVGCNDSAVRDAQLERDAFRSVAGDLWNVVEGLREHWEGDADASLIDGYLKRYEELAR